MAVIAFYSGSFDPVTFGHLDIIARSLRFCDKLVIGVGVHSSKKSLMTAQNRVELLQETASPLAAEAGAALEVVTFDNLVVKAATDHGAQIIIRGLRDATDFDYEVQMGQMNAAMARNIETVFLVASPETRMIASSLVKQIAQMGGDISAFVPAAVLRALSD